MFCLSLSLYPFYCVSFTILLLLTKHAVSPSGEHPAKPTHLFLDASKANNLNGTSIYNNGLWFFCLVSFAPLYCSFLPVFLPFPSSKLFDRASFLAGCQQLLLLTLTNKLLFLSPFPFVSIRFALSFLSPFRTDLITCQPINQHLLNHLLPDLCSLTTQPNFELIYLTNHQPLLFPPRFALQLARPPRRAAPAPRRCTTLTRRMRMSCSSRRAISLRWSRRLTTTGTRARWADEPASFPSATSKCSSQCPNRKGEQNFLER